MDAGPRHQRLHFAPFASLEQFQQLNVRRLVATTSVLSITGAAVSLLAQMNHRLLVDPLRRRRIGNHFGAAPSVSVQRDALSATISPGRILPLHAAVRTHNIRTTTAHGSRPRIVARHILPSLTSTANVAFRVRASPIVRPT